MSGDQDAIANLMKELADKFTNQLQKEIASLHAVWTEKEKRWEKERSVLIQSQAELESRIDALERRERKTNITLNNWHCDDNNTTTKAAVEQLFKRKLGQSLTITDAFKINTQKGSKVIVKLGTFEEKMFIFKNKQKLSAEVNGVNRPVYVDDDLSKKDQEIQFYGRQEAKLLKGKGVTAKIGFKKLQVNGKWFNWVNMEKKFDIPKDF